MVGRNRQDREAGVRQAGRKTGLLNSQRLRHSRYAQNAISQAHQGEPGKGDGTQPAAKGSHARQSGKLGGGVPAAFSSPGWNINSVQEVGRAAWPARAACCNSKEMRLSGAAHMKSKRRLAAAWPLRLPVTYVRT